MPSAGTTGWSLGWLAETGYAAANPNRGTARRETGQLEPELCYRGAGPGRRRGFTWTAGEIRRPTLHVKYCTIKCRTHRSQSIPPYLQSPPSIPFSTTSPRLLLCYSFLSCNSGCFSVSLRIRSAGNLVSLIERQSLRIVELRFELGRWWTRIHFATEREFVVSRYD